MKNSALVLALIVAPVSYTFADPSVSHAVMAMSDLKIKVVVFIGCMLIGALFGALLVRCMSKKNPMLRDLTFLFSVLTGCLIGMLFFLGRVPM
ncbi:hypothetical protein [Pseudomonas antarctica]|uniref:hypothetical protein n=1 Tax=Pseudomonas antarctica TaxID=219572 RepID=UPI0012E854C4|nr:hypothetical protein [Pseudomonas antarctica]